MTAMPPLTSVVKKQAWWKSKPVIGAATLVLGLGIGASGETDPADSDVYRALKQDHSVVSTSLAESESQLEGLKQDFDEVGTTLVSKDLEISKLATELEDARLQEVAFETQVTELQEKQVALEKEKTTTVNKAETKTKDNAPVPLVQPKAPAAKAPAAKAPAAKAFKNCTEARNAGAAPVYKSDPGYGKHLDRDGDGVGCE